MVPWFLFVVPPVTLLPCSDSNICLLVVILLLDQQHTQSEGQGMSPHNHLSKLWCMCHSRFLCTLISRIPNLSLEIVSLFQVRGSLAIMNQILQRWGLLTTMGMNPEKYREQLHLFQARGSLVNMSQTLDFRPQRYVQVYIFNEQPKA